MLKVGSRYTKVAVASSPMIGWGANGSGTPSSSYSPKPNVDEIRKRVSSNRARGVTGKGTGDRAIRVVAQGATTKPAPLKAVAGVAHQNPAPQAFSSTASQPIKESVARARAGVASKPPSPTRLPTSTAVAPTSVPKASKFAGIGNRWAKLGTKGKVGIGIAATAAGALGAKKLISKKRNTNA